jgi:glycosyltransferase involved in cell wall biosynthesis
MPVVSVLMPVYNGERFLAAAIDSALAQTFQDLEVIVIDDGSTDRSAAIAADYAARFPDKVIVVSQANGGISLARNAGIGVARGRFLAVLDADDLWLPHHIAECVNVLEARSDVGLVHANIERIDADGTHRQAVQRYWNQFKTDAFATFYLRYEHISCPTVVFRRELVDQVGPFDAAFTRLGSEDRDMWLRCAAVSEIVFIDEVHACYRMHAAGVSRNLDRMHRSRMALVEKFSKTPRGGPLRRRALAAAYRGLGEDMLGAGRRSDAVRAYATAVMYGPNEVRAWKALLRSVMLPMRRHLGS